MSADQKGRMTNEVQAVGWPNSTDEGAKFERYKRWREVEKEDRYPPVFEPYGTSFKGKH